MQHCRLISCHYACTGEHGRVRCQRGVHVLVCIHTHMHTCAHTNTNDYTHKHNRLHTQAQTSTHGTDTAAAQPRACAHTHAAAHMAHTPHTHTHHKRTRHTHKLTRTHACTARTNTQHTHLTICSSTCARAVLVFFRRARSERIMMLGCVGIVRGSASMPFHLFSECVFSECRAVQ
jgi:hypothetical protein